VTQTVFTLPYKVSVAAWQSLVLPILAISVMLGLLPSRPAKDGC
jgi:hypothetical protein